MIPIKGNDVVVRTIDLPTTVKGFVSESPDGTYNIYINARHSEQVQRETYEHELDHIKRGDLQSTRPIRCLERRATIGDRCQEPPLTDVQQAGIASFIDYLLTSNAQQEKMRHSSTTHSKRFDIKR